MLLQLFAFAYFDFLQQFASLVRDPVGYGFGVPPGDGRPILLIPGFTAGDWSLGTMARWLGRVGYRPYLSGIDLNVGCPRRTMEVVGWRVEKIARESGQRVTIIGHSLGGVLGRAIAAANPANVREVVALGSPIRDGWTGVHDQVRPTLQAIQSFWQTFSDEPKSCGTAECSCAFVAAALAPTPGRSRFSAIYTRRDEVVQWRSCVDDAGSNFEVSGLHASLIVNREVYRILGSILAEAPGESAAA
ncbi:MAG: alpha/beta fold hydrolase [Candidatus Binatus sp.]|jgi:pimeloyl-ACP methyl ester carboxylesterase|uniref:esterase/lipase family protein n=1 Tax=Candidatus Binatus sp. TaxID=2811406 RepID=UPI003D12905D